MRRRPVRFFVALCTLMLLVIGTSASELSGIAQDASSAVSTFSNQFVWRNVGPAKIGGAVSDIAATRVATSTYQSVLKIYAAGPGGLFESDDEGSRWNQLLANYPGSAAVNSVTTSPTNPDEVWIGTGDPTGFFRQIPGDGVYRSPDGGKHWQLVGFHDSPYIGFVRFNPADPHTIYVGALGDLRHPSSARGLYRSTDGGRTWQQILHVNDWTGPVDISFDPSDPKTLYVAMQQEDGDRLVFLDYGPGSGVFKSTDGGTTWQRFDFGVPNNFMLARSAVAVAPSMPSRVYAVVDSRPSASSGNFDGNPREETWLYRSDDYGKHWLRTVSVDRGETWSYWGRIFVDPRNADRIYIAGARLLVSDDGGKTLVGEKNAHYYSMDAPEYDNYGIDVHSLWIDPDDTTHLVLGDDHGIFFSYTAGKTWKHVENLTMARVYGIGLGWTLPFTPVVVAMQDSFDFAGPIVSAGRDGITNEDWHALYVGSETGNGGVDPSDSDIFYGINGQTEFQMVVRDDVTDDDYQELGPLAPLGKKNAPEFVGHPRLGTLVVVKNPRSTLYVGTTRVWRSFDHGAHWQAISPMFAHIDSRPDHIMGRVTRDGALSWKGAFGGEDVVITSIAPSPLRPAVIYAGTRHGIFAVTRDGGAHWETQSLPRALRNAEVTKIVASRFVPGRVYISLTRFYDVDLRPYILESNDYGKDWRSISPANMPGAAVWTMLENPHRPGLVIAGTERGVIATVNDGVSWFQLGTGLPNVRVVDMALQPQSQNLVIGTWGSGVWVLDNLTPLTRAVDPGCPALFNVPPAFEYFKKDWTYYEAPVFTAPNPPFGAQITYYLPPLNHPGSVEIRISTSSGKIIRRLMQPYTVGLHAAAWNLRLPSIYAQLSTDETTRRIMQTYEGPFVLPGTYRVAVLVQGAGGCSARMQSTVTVAIANEAPSVVREFIHSYPQRLEAYTLQQQTTRISEANEAFALYLKSLQTIASKTNDAILTRHLYALRLQATAITDSAKTVDAFVQNVRQQLDAAAFGEYEGSFRALMPGDARLLTQAVRRAQSTHRQLANMIAREQVFVQHLSPQDRAALENPLVTAKYLKP